MPLALRIENETSLPDGGPLSVTVSGKRGIDIGRDSHLDWTLPDPTRHVSSKHCEVRYRDGGYWLYDVSTNGTFLNGSDGRLKTPHRLRNGDRLGIGHYLISVALDGPEAEAPSGPARVDVEPVSYHELWTSSAEAAPPIDPKELRPRGEHAPVNPDFLDWAADVPDLDDQRAPMRPQRAAPREPDGDLSWAQGEPTPAPTVEPPPPIPSPRRPVWVAREPAGAWAPSVDDHGGATATPESETTQPPPELPARPLPAPEPPDLQPAAAMSGDFIHYVARGAGLSDEIFARQSPEQLAEQLGALTRIVSENVRQLLNARQQAKRLARSTSQTTIQALDNNPLKFAPTTEDALRIMFGPATTSYLDSRRAFEQSFEDLKKHQIRTFAAMQQALAMLVEDLDPQAIEHDTAPDKGITALVASRKARLWDTYVARWQKKKRRYEGGLVDVFMDYFAECYDRGNEVR